MSSRATKHWLAVGILILCAAAQGFGFITAKASLQAQVALVPGESSWFIAAQNLAPRFLFGVLMLIAIYGARVLRLTRCEWTQAGVMMGCSAIGCMFQLDGLQYTSGSVTAFFTQFYIVLIPIWAAVTFRRWPRWSVYLAVILVTLGLGLLAEVDWRELRLGRGESEVLIASVFFSFMLFSINLPRFASNRPERAAVGMFMMEAVFFTIMALATQQTDDGFTAPLISVQWWILVLTTAFIATIGPFVLIVHWQRLVSVTEAGMIYGLTPVFTLFSGLFLPAWIAQWTGIAYDNEILTTVFVVGAVLVVAANVVMQLYPTQITPLSTSKPIAPDR